MNPLLSHLQPYPFERLRQLFSSVTPNPSLRPISLGMGEPKHATPAFIQQAMVDSIRSTPSGLAAYPGTAGEPKLRESFTRWMKQRYALDVNPATQVLPVNGSREALFALTQTVIQRAPAGSAADQTPMVVCPNPFYQIYEGAALLAGAEPYFVPSDAARNFAQDWDSQIPSLVAGKFDVVHPLRAARSPVLQVNRQI